MLKEKIGQVGAGMTMGGHRVTVGEILLLVEADYEVEKHRSPDRLEYASAKARPHKSGSSRAEPMPSSGTFSSSSPTER